MIMGVPGGGGGGLCINVGRDVPTLTVTFPGRNLYRAFENEIENLAKFIKKGYL